MTSSQSKPVCYLHIGPHKTGSTSIQHYMKANVEALAERGLVYPSLPKAEGKPEKPHNTLTTADEIDANGADGKPMSANWRAIHDVVSKGKDNVLISSEIFASTFRDEKKLDAVLSFFERYGYAIKVIAYVRDQPGWLNSWYVQEQKRFVRRCSFRDYVQRESLTGRVDPWRYLEHFIDNPRLTLDIVSFDAACRSGLEEDFARRCGVATEGLTPPAMVNPNAGAKTVFAAQKIMAERPVNLRANPKYKAIFQTFKRAYNRLGWHATPYMALNGDLYAEIREEYREGNDRFAQRFFGVASWSELFPDRTYARKIFEPKTATEEEMAEIRAVIDEVVRVIDKHSKGLNQAAMPGSDRKRLEKKAKRRAREAAAAAAGGSSAAKQAVDA